MYGSFPSLYFKFPQPNTRHGIGIETIMVRVSRFVTRRLAGIRNREHSLTKKRRVRVLTRKENENHIYPYVYPEPFVLIDFTMALLQQTNSIHHQLSRDQVDGASCQWNNSVSRSDSVGSNSAGSDSSLEGASACAAPLSVSASSSVSQRREPTPWNRLTGTQKSQYINIIEERIELMKSDLTCKVCLEQSVNRAFKPCGHLSCCNVCAKQLKECPICRKSIQGIVVVALPRTRKVAVKDMDLFLKKYRYMGLYL